MRSRIPDLWSPTRSRTPPLWGRGWGGVSDILSKKKIQTDSTPAPPLEGRGAA